MAQAEAMGTGKGKGKPAQQDSAPQQRKSGILSAEQFLASTGLH